mmetsp:Transcript_9470/g.27041  ORF Transcript_9470/g.27041 Transcript_9470/m.27041 type:complete len:262 (+) Transcript_9470:2211-2996(+)
MGHDDVFPWWEGELRLEGDLPRLPGNHKAIGSCCPAARAIFGRHRPALPALSHRADGQEGFGKISRAICGFRVRLQAHQAAVRGDGVAHRVHVPREKDLGGLPGEVGRDAGVAGGHRRAVDGVHPAGGAVLVVHTLLVPQHLSDREHRCPHAGGYIIGDHTVLAVASPGRVGHRVVQHLEAEMDYHCVLPGQKIHIGGQRQGPVAAQVCLVLRGVGGKPGCVLNKGGAGPHLCPAGVDVSVRDVPLAVVHYPGGHVLAHRE